MCGIVGYVGSSQAGPILIEGLRRLEYRGYDSAGIAISNGNGSLEVMKRAGKLRELEAAILAEGMPPGTCGIAHTRWATHGAPNRTNAHPHASAAGDIALIHNGIIENAGSLRTGLSELGYVFQTETDTETVVHLIDEAFKENESLEAAVAAALHQVEGAYGIAVLSTRDPGKLVVARNGSPLLIGLGQDGQFMVASDATAVVQHTRDVIYLNDGDYAVLSADGYETLNLGTGAVSRRSRRAAMTTS